MSIISYGEPIFQVVGRYLKGRCIFIMREYTEILNKFLNGKRNIRRKVYKVLGRAYRAVNSGIISWDEAVKIMGI